MLNFKHSKITTIQSYRYYHLWCRPGFNPNEKHVWERGFLFSTLFEPFLLLQMLVYDTFDLYCFIYVSPTFLLPTAEEGNTRDVTMNNEEQQCYDTRL